MATHRTPRMTMRGCAVLAVATIGLAGIAPGNACAETYVPSVDKPVDQAFIEFAEALLYHEDRAVREAAAHALGRIGGEAAYAALEKAGFLDWPMWQYDAVRSGATPMLLPDQLHVQWVRALPAPRRAWRHQWDHRGTLDFDVSYAPVVKGERIFVPSNATDSVTAYSTRDGAELWRFYANGPVRLAPAAWEDRVYFVSDDGHLYCVNAADGDLVWKFRGGPSDLHLLGNERIVNLWAARGGPVVLDGVVYFAAGFWPLHGVFIYAVDADTGERIWVNDTTSSEFVPLPHGGAFGYGGLAPQGYIAADEEKLVVSGGRAAAAHLSRADGSVLYMNPHEVGKGGGGYAVHAGGIGFLRNPDLDQRVAALSDQIDGDVFNVLAARGRLYVTTTKGALYCFGPDEGPTTCHALAPTPVKPRSDAWAVRADQLIEELGESEGYALLLGAGSGDLLRELLLRSELHVTVVESDAAVVHSLRDELVSAGLYGERAAVIEASPAGFSVQPYLFSLVACENARQAGLSADATALAAVLDRVRPYGGVAWIGGGPRLQRAAASAEVDQIVVEPQDGGAFARRGGPLTGADQWTHQYHDPANTLVSLDERVRLPLGLLWYGGPSNHNALPRHAGGPRPHVAGGRVVHLGVDNIAARCVYTGRLLWDRPFPGIGHPFTDLALEEKWREGEEVYMTNRPGATYIGSPFVTLPDSVYLRYGHRIFRLDPATGETLGEFPLPGRAADDLYGTDAPEWGHIKVQDDYLIATSEPHVFEDQQLGSEASYSGTSSKLLAVLNRFTGETVWTRDAQVGFRHNAIIAADDTVFLIDGLSELAVDFLARRGQAPETPSRILALDLATGDERWRSDSSVFGVFLLYCREHDLLIEGGSRDLRRPMADEPLEMAARRASDGEILWERGGDFTLPGAVLGDMLIPGRPGVARSLLTGKDWERRQPHTGEVAPWTYNRAYGCNTMNASRYLLLYRSGYAGFFDLEFDTGTGNFGGFRSGCTANMIAADGVLNAPDYTRSCTCSYQNQTSLALVHMPDDACIELWTRFDGASPDPEGYGINFGAPGRRVDRATGRVWHDQEGALRRHPSAIAERGDGIAWVLSSARELSREEPEPVAVYDLLETRYTVRLCFAELVESVQPGDRVFDVLIDGNEVLHGYDIAAAAGGCLRGVVEEVSVQSGMTMEIAFRRAEGSELGPLINGIELIAEDADLQVAAADAAQ